METPSDQKMYPATYFQTFLRCEPSTDVFVAMPFTAEFEKVFETILDPAIRMVKVNGVNLTPRIINRGTSGSPDIHEQIFDAIIHSRLVIADMTVQASFRTDSGKQRWQANANVAYEVGLASAWRNPEDILLIHQSHLDHQYSFDVQNLRHVEYNAAEPAKSIMLVANEILRAISASVFLSNRAFEKLVQSISPTAIQYMHLEKGRTFPVLRFINKQLGMVDGKATAVSELLAIGALKNRNTWALPEDPGATIIFEWTKLGLRLLAALRIQTPERIAEISRHIESCDPNRVPPLEYISFPPEVADVPAEESNVTSPTDESSEV